MRRTHTRSLVEGDHDRLGSDSGRPGVLAPTQEVVLSADLASGHLDSVRASSVVGQPDDHVASVLGRPGVIAVTRAPMLSVLQSTEEGIAAVGSTTDCGDKACSGASEAVTYLCYFRSGKYTGSDIQRLAEEFCAKNALTDTGGISMVSILTSEAEISADEMCPPPGKCFCAISSTGTHTTYEQYLSPKGADELAKALKLVGRNAASALDPSDPAVPESARVYLRLECRLTVSGKCSPVKKAI